MAAELVNSLLPQESGFMVVVTDPDGRPVKPSLPALGSWVFVWRVVSSFAHMYLALE
jgi:hypothetical protein